MTSFIKFITSKLFINVFFMLIQFVIIAYVIRYLVFGNYILFLIFYALSILIILIIASLDSNPTYKVAWLIVIMLFPFYGTVIYIFFGNKRVGRKFKKKVDKFQKSSDLDSFLAQFYDENEKNFQELGSSAKDILRHFNYLNNTSRFLLWKDTNAQYFPFGEDFFIKAIEDIKGAKKSIYLEYFILDKGYMLDTIIDLLREKIKENVEVKLIYDAFLASQNLPSSFAKKLRKEGFNVVIFNPLKPHLHSRMNYRDHRKLLIIDDKIGYCGGMNLADEYINKKIRFGQWKDTAVRLEGRAVHSLTLMFLQIWCFSTNQSIQSFMPLIENDFKCENNGYTLAFSDSPFDDINVSESVYLQMINNAKNRIWITTPYLILDNVISNALEVAARSLVDVRIICPYYHDKWYVHPITQSNYMKLLKAGVKIYEYLPGFIHAKMVLCDDNLAVVGTTNMDYRSFYHNFECGVVFYDHPVIKDIEDDFKKTIEDCYEISIQKERSISIFKKLLRTILSVFSPVL